ncbi:MFS transporter [Megamonas funiformis]|uniref:MFS transporter n=1 Tax=Megamonas funiformis TaxID=437897 RepID=UPI002430C6EB|nr:MFS transporter [Megamonas funiformis]
MKSFFWNLFKTAPDAALIQDKDKVKQKFNMLRWRVFVSITIGYAFYYIIRQSYSVIKKPLLASGIVTPEQVGIIGSIFFVTYGLGKFTNSFLADRLNNKRFFSFGLFISSITMVGMGLVNSFVPLAILWGLNGWFQSYGAGPSIVSLNQWFSNKERGTLYGIWFTSHNLGSIICLFCYRCCS